MSDVLFHNPYDSAYKIMITFFVVILLLLFGSIIYVASTSEDKCEIVGGSQEYGLSKCYKEIDGKLYSGIPVKIDGEYKFRISTEYG